MEKVAVRNVVGRVDHSPVVSFEFTGDGIGTMRSTGELILMLLTFEDECLRADVLANVACDLGISLEELTVSYLKLENKEV